MTPPLRMAPSERVGKRFESTESFLDPSESRSRLCRIRFGTPTLPPLALRPPGDLQIAVVIETDVAKLHAPPPLGALFSFDGEEGREKSEAAREGGFWRAAAAPYFLKGTNRPTVRFARCCNKNRGNLTFYSSINRLSLQ